MDNLYQSRPFSALHLVLKEKIRLNEQSWSAYKLRVRYQETDQMGVVYHANYLNWFEIGRTEWIRSRGLTYRDLEQQGLKLPVTDAQIKYVQPAKYDDIVTVYTRLSELSGIRTSFEVEIRKIESDQSAKLDSFDYEDRVTELEGERLVYGKTRHAWLGSDWKPVRIDREFPELFNLLHK